MNDKTTTKPGPVSQKNETADQLDRAKLERKLTVLRRAETGLTIVALGSALVGFGGLAAGSFYFIRGGNEATSLNRSLKSEKETLGYFDQKMNYSLESLTLSLSPGSKSNDLAKAVTVIPALEELRAKNAAMVLASSNALAQVKEGIKRIEGSQDYKAQVKKNDRILDVSLALGALGLSFASVMGFASEKISKKREALEGIEAIQHLKEIDRYHDTV